MRTTPALELIFVAVLMLALAVPEALFASALEALGVSARSAALWGAYLSTALAGTGFVLLLFGLVRLVRTHTREEAWRPYVRVLTPLASEYGLALDQHPVSGLTFHAKRDGQLAEVRVSPRDALVVVTCAVAPRQPLAWLPRNATTEAPVRDWAVAGTGRAWELRAEIPTMARPILEDGGLRDQLDRFFGRDEAIAVLHLRGSGIEVRASAGAVDKLERQVREQLDIAFRLRRANG